MDTDKKTPSWAKRDKLTKAEVLVKLEELQRAAYGIASATTGDADVRAGAMDRCHVLRAAIHYLQGGR